MDIFKEVSTISFVHGYPEIEKIIAHRLKVTEKNHSYYLFFENYVDAKEKRNFILNEIKNNSNYR